MGDRFYGLPVNLASFYVSLGELDQAEETLRAVADPDAPSIVASLGMVYQQSGEYDRAAEQLEKAWSLEPSLVTLVRLCALKLLDDDLPGAVQVSERPIESGSPLLPFFAAACRQLAAQQGGRATEAAAILERLIEQTPTPQLKSVFRIWAGRLELWRGRPEVTLQHMAAVFEDVPEQQPYNIALFYSGLAELQGGRTDAAREVAAELGRLADQLGYPQEKRRHLHLQAAIDLAEGDAAAARAGLEEAAAMLPARSLWGAGQVPDDVPLWYSLAAAYRAAGEMELSAETLRRILGPQDGRWFYPILYVRSLYLLGEHHRQRGEDEQAAEYFRRFLRNWDGGELEPEWVAAAKRFLDPSLRL